MRGEGAEGLSLRRYGAKMRGEARAHSDVDVLVEIDRTRKFSLMDRAGLRLFLSDILGCPVDLAVRDGLKPFFGDSILAEAVEVSRWLHRQPGNRSPTSSLRSGLSPPSRFTARMWPR